MSADQVPPGIRHTRDLCELRVFTGERKVVRERWM